MKKEDLHLFGMLEFRPDEGKIFCEDERMLVWTASAFGALQKLLLARLGVDEARKILCQFGFRHGFHSYLTAEQLFGKVKVGSGIATRFHEVVGFGKYTNTRATEPPSFRFESNYVDSVEAEAYRTSFGTSDIPVCWWAVAFASGYCSARFDLEAYYKEIHCSAQGHPECQVLGQDAEQWGEEAQPLRADYGFSDAADAAEFRRQQYELHREWHRNRERARSAGIAGGSKSSMRQRLETFAKEHNFIVREEAMWEVLENAMYVAKLNTPVLIHGETGTGKEFVAELIHQNSARSNRAFVSINCAALTETLLESELFGHVRGAFTGAVADKRGLFELASEGTLFLDEIGEIPFGLQAKLLRVLENGEMRRVGSTQLIRVNPRVIAATHRDLQALSARGEFRQDLYFRLNAFVVELPPLRTRRDSIPPMVQYFTQQVSEAFGKRVEAITPEAMARLCAYDWPGNVRQLRHAIERAIVVARRETIDVPDLPAEISISSLKSQVQPIDLGRCALKDGERQVILSTLAQHDGNRAATAATLGIDVSTLWRKMRRHGLL
jgi:DNA-binding NtrC family response regulator